MKLNQIYIIGNLVKDAETKEMQNGKKKQIFTLAVNDDYKPTNSTEWVKRAYFIDCYIMGKEYNNLKKGTSVFVTGKLISRTYEVSGQKKKYTAIEVNGIEFVHYLDSSYYETTKAKTVEEVKQEEEVEDLPF